MRRISSTYHTFIFISLFILSCIFSKAISAASPMGLKEIIGHSRQSQVDWQKAVIELKKAEESVTHGRSKFLPDLALSSRLSRDWQSEAMETEKTGSNASVLSSWSIYDNGTSFRNYRMRLLEFNKAKAQERVVRENVSFEILSRYLNHFFVRRKKEINEQKLGLLKNHHRIIERQFRQGLKTRTDYKRLEGELERAKLNLMRLEDQVTDSFEEIRRFAGDSLRLDSFQQLKTLEPQDFLDKLLKRDRAAEFNARQAPAALVSAQEIEINKIKTRETNASLWPRLNLSAEVGYGSQNFVDSKTNWNDGERVFGLAQLQLTWTLWDWGGRPSLHRQAILDERYSETSYNQNLLDLKTKYSRLQRQSERQAITVKVTRDIYTIEAKTFQDIESEYRQGRATYLDLITSLDRRIQTQLELEEELNSYLLSTAEKLQIRGKLYEACMEL